MAEFKFSCPGCNQHIQLDELWGGHQIQCPNCNAEIIVPQVQTSAAPAAPAAPRGAPGPPAVPTSARLSKAAAPAPAAPAAPAPQPQTRFVPQRGPAKPAPSSSKAKITKWAYIGGGVAALGVGLYFGIPYVLNLQDKFSAKTREEAKKSDGGEMGHIANLYNVLDATEPGGRGLSGLNKGHGPRERSEQMTFPVPTHPTGAPGVASVAQPDLPVIPAVWSLDSAITNIPEGRANGMLAGTNFLVETARIEPVGAAQVLHLSQGAGTSPDRELFIYLHPKPGEGVSKQSWTISKDMTAGLGVPEVKKRWKTDPRYAPTLKSFASGYVMKLELGEVTNSAVAGKIYLALPDTEKSVVAGVFNAAIVTAAPAANMSQAPMAPMQRRSQDAAFDERYGRKRQ